MPMTFQARSLTMALCLRALRWATVTTLLCTAPLPAQAAGPDTPAASVEEAKALFVKARAAVKEGNLAEALVLFRKSYRQHQAPGTLLNMADCEDKLGFTASAWLHYDRLTLQLPPNDERLPLVKERAAALKPRVGWLQIKLASGAPVGTTVTQDGDEFVSGNLGAVLPADPMAHVIVVTAPGHKERRYQVTIAEGKQETLMVEPGQEIAPVVAAPSTGNPARTAGFILGGVGIAGLGVGAVTGILAIAKKNEVARLCPEPKQCTPEGVAIEGTGKAFAAASTVAFAAGLATLGVGTYLVLSNREKPAPTAAFAPLFLPGGAGLGASGTF